MITLNPIPPEWREWANLLYPLWLLASPALLSILFWWSGSARKAEDHEKDLEAGGAPPDSGVTVRLGQPDFLRQAAANLESPDSNARAKAARLLGECKDPQGVGALVMALRDENRNVRFWAAWALGAIKDPRGVESLIASLKDPDEGVRYRAAEALGEIKDPRGLAPLDEALKDSGEGVCQIAAWALKQIEGRPEAGAAALRKAAVAVLDHASLTVTPPQEEKAAPPPAAIPAFKVAAPQAETPKMAASETPGSITDLGAEPEGLAALPPLIEAVMEPPASEPDSGESPGPNGREMLGVISLATGIRPKEAEAHYILGQTFTGLSQWTNAIASYKRALKCKPDMAEAYGNLGLAYGQIGSCHEALIFLKQALRFEPKAAALYTNLGVTYGLLGRWPEAMEAFRSAIHTETQDFTANYNLGVVYGRMGRWPEAAEAFQLAAAQNPEDLEAHYNLGIALGQMGRWPEAIAAFQKIIGLKAGHAEARRHLGLAYCQSGRWLEAISAFQQVVQQNPDNVEAHLNLGGMYGHLGRWPEAVEAFKRAREIEPQEVLATQALGVACGQLGQWQEAAEMFRRALVINEGSETESLDLEMHQPQQIQEMAATLKEAVKFKPDLAEAHYLLGLASARLENWQDAALAFFDKLNLSSPAEGEQREGAGGPSYYQAVMKTLSQTVRMKPELARMRYHRGAVGTGGSDNQEKLGALKRATDNNPTEDRAHLDLGLAYVQMGRYQEAVMAFKMVLRLNPENAMAHYRLALIHRTLGDLPAAVDEYAVLKTLDKQLAEQIFK